MSSSSDESSTSDSTPDENELCDKKLIQLKTRTKDVENLKSCDRITELKKINMSSSSDESSTSDSTSDENELCDEKLIQLKTQTKDVGQCKQKSKLVQIKKPSKDIKSSDAVESFSSEQDSDEEENTKEEKNELDDEAAVLKKQLMEMSFDELQMLKEKIGLKAYKEAMFGPSTEQIVSKKKVFKRKNKNRPMEMSSKKSVSRFKEVVHVKKKLPRDPRFDDLSGEYSEHFMKEAYSFIGDLKQREKVKLLKKYKKEHDPEKKEQLEGLIKRMNQQEQSEKDKDAVQKRKRERKKKEKEMVKDGKKPFYLKKSDQKTLELAEKYRELKKSGKLDKYLQRKRKKNASKEKKKLPNRAN